MKRFRIEEHPLFSADDVAPAVNAVVAAMEPGDQAVLSLSLIHIFKDKSLRQNAVKEYTLPLYSPFALDMESRYALSEFDRDEMQIMLPAFGVKLGDNGFAAILEKEMCIRDRGSAPEGETETLNIKYSGSPWEQVLYCPSVNRGTSGEGSPP